jgi:hypothetical protein
MNSSRSLAAAIERYLEEDGSGDAGSAATGSTAVVDRDTRRQLRQLTQTTDQLKTDMTAMKNNMQMGALLPLLLNQKLSVVSDTLGTLTANEVIEFKHADPLSALLPVMLMGGLESSGGSANSSNTMLLMLALTGVI